MFEEIKIVELYNLLTALNEEQNLIFVSDRLFWSTSKTTKKIQFYEKKLNISIYRRKNDCNLTAKGKILLKDIEQPYQKLNQIFLKKENNFIGVDDILVEEKFSFKDIKFFKNDELIKKYKNGELNKIICSKDYENEFKYNEKTLFMKKKYYKILNVNSLNNPPIYSYEKNCSITKKLEKRNIKVDKYVSSSRVIIALVKLNQCKGFSFEKIIDKDISAFEEGKISFYLYEK